MKIGYNLRIFGADKNKSLDLRFLAPLMGNKVLICAIIIAISTNHTNYFGSIISSKLVDLRIVANLFAKSVEIICMVCGKIGLNFGENHSRPAHA